MPAAFASSAVEGGCVMRDYSQIANVCASREIRRIVNDLSDPISHNANMDDAEDKNGGPNHLRAWMRYRNVKGAELAAKLGGNVTPGMVSDLANSKRALSAKWLRRIAPLLDTTPGMLLDHDPTELPADIVEIWLSASDKERRQLVNLAQAIVRTGTDG